jgi:hypothetical protein
MINPSGLSQKVYPERSGAAVPRKLVLPPACLGKKKDKYFAAIPPNQVNFTHVLEISLGEVTQHLIPNRDGIDTILAHVKKSLTFC